MSVSRDPIGPYHDHLALLHDQLRIAQIAMYRQNRKVIIALEGYDASGKGGVIRELSYAWAPRGFEVYPSVRQTPSMKPASMRSMRLNAC